MNNKHYFKTQARLAARREKGIDEVADFVEREVDMADAAGLFVSGQVVLERAQRQYPGIVHADGIALLATVVMRGAQMHDLYRQLR